MKNWVLVKDFGKSNTSDRIYYVMNYEDLPTLVQEKPVVFGDKAYIIKDGEMLFMGNDEKWYNMNGEEILKGGKNGKLFIS